MKKFMHLHLGFSYVRVSHCALTAKETAVFFVPSVFFVCLNAPFKSRRREMGKDGKGDLKGDCGIGR